MSQEPFTMVTPPGRTRRVGAGQVLGVLCLLAAAGALAWALRDTAEPEPPRRTASDVLTSPPVAPFLLFANMSPDAYRRVALVPLGAPGGPRYVTSLVCDRVHMANGRGICLTTTLEGVVTVHRAHLMDAAFHVTAAIALTGVPSRARMSPDGRLAAVTVFESGHGYSDAGFSTRTTILDAVRGTEIGHLEQFTVLRDGRPFSAVDFNFWGVTFAADSDRFFATLATGGAAHLVEGRVRERRVRLTGARGECPSLSPGNRRLAYKHRVAGTNAWQIHVLDLDTQQVTPLEGETRSVDDQVEWLDDTHVLYHVTGAGGADVWQLDATSPSAPPSRVIQFAYSPAIVR